MSALTEIGKLFGVCDTINKKKLYLKHKFKCTIPNHTMINFMDFVILFNVVDIIVVGIVGISLNNWLILLWFVRINILSAWRMNNDTAYRAL